MKRIIFTLILMLPLSTILAQDDSEESKDYNWTLFTDATEFTYVSGDGLSGGLLSVGALYNISEKLQAGAKSHRGSAVKFESNVNALFCGILAGFGEKLMV